MYGGGFDILATLAAKILPFGLFETRRLVGALVGLVGLLVTWRLGRRLGGPFAGLVSLVLLAACPLYYGHMFINAKDGPFAAVMVIALLGLVRAFEEYPRATPATLALCGVGIGLSIGARVLGGFAVLEALLPLPLIFAIRARANGPKPAAAECGFVFGPVHSGGDPCLSRHGPGLAVERGFAAQSFSCGRIFFEFFRKTLARAFRRPVDPGRRHAAELRADAIRGPSSGAHAGAGARRNGRRARCRTVEPRSRRRRRRTPRRVFSTALAAMLPILLTVAARPVMYNGIRHFVFVLPPFAVLGGLAAAWIARAACGAMVAPPLAAGGLALIAGIASPVIDMVRLHPYEYTDYNHIAGGVAGAQQTSCWIIGGCRLRRHRGSCLLHRRAP